MGKKRIKSKERVAEHGEVFTNEREVKAMCDLVKDETERIDSRVLEIKTPILYIIPNGQVSFLNVNDISI